jgi:predicted nuclease of restriction endonuclease-like (RecB) superfamily
VDHLLPEYEKLLAQIAETRADAPTVPETGQLSAAPILQRAVVQLSWAHNVILIQKLKHLPTRLWYARQTLEQGWSRDTLAVQIKNRAHERQGAAVTNFSTTLPEAHAALARGLLKDPYLFDFLTLEEPFHERELETGLLAHIQTFLIELGRGFAFVGRQYRLEVSDREFYLDLLFYHLHLRCFVVVDLKKGDFKPEYAGKMNFYCSVVDDQLRHPEDAPTIGLILCQTKDRILAEYALRDINKPIGVADYELTRALPAALVSSLPSIEDIEAELFLSMKDED